MIRRSEANCWLCKKVLTLGFLKLWGSFWYFIDKIMRIITCTTNPWVNFYTGSWKVIIWYWKMTKKLNTYFWVENIHSNKMTVGNVCKWVFSILGRRQKKQCRSSSWTIKRLLSSIQTPSRDTPSPTTSPSARWKSPTQPSPASSMCTRRWPNLCWWGPSKDSTPACLLTARRAQGSPTRECPSLSTLLCDLFGLLINQ